MSDARKEADDSALRSADRPSAPSIPAGHWWNRLPGVAGAVFLAAAGLSLALGTSDWDGFFRAYYVAYIFFLSVALGGLCFVLLQHVTSSRWSVVVRRIAEDVMGTVPLFIILFVPIALNLEHIFRWAAPTAGADGELTPAKAVWLDPTFFLIRAGVYLVVWSALARYFLKSSVRQDTTGDAEITHRLQVGSPLALIIFGLTVTGAAFDWLMSLDPRWYSTIFGVYFFSGLIVCGFAVLTVVAVALKSAGLVDDVITREHFHDLGKLLFAFTVFWAYIAFSQYLLIWYGNIPEETHWFLDRWGGSWSSVSLLLGIGHFGVPFFFLMSRHIKRRTRTLLVGAVWMLLMHLVDVYWVIVPSLPRAAGQGEAPLGWLDLTVLIGIGASWVAVLALRLKRQALIPVHDPRLAESLAFENF